MKIERCKKKVLGKRLFCIFPFVLLYLLAIYVYNEQEQTRKVFESLSVTFKDSPMIEYGTDHYNVEEFVKDSFGKVEITKGNLDPMRVGMQEVVLQVEKDGAKRVFSFKVEVKDTKAPQIEVKEKFLSFMVNDAFDPISNIALVYDLVDGNLDYVPFDQVREGQSNYYTYETDLNMGVAGEYDILVRATDKHLNTSFHTFTVKVEEPVIEKDPIESFPSMDTEMIHMDMASDGSKMGIVNTARSLLGLPYVSGGDLPSGFDCSGFVSYVYSTNGISVPRTTGGQLYVGTSVSLEDAMPGDILVFGTSPYSGPTHTAIYIGGGEMIHAANPKKGVIISNVHMYVSYGSYLLSVRSI